MARAPAVQEIEALPEADRLEGFPHPRETRHPARARGRGSRCWPKRLPVGACTMPGCSQGVPGSARRRWPTAWRGMCWRGRTSGTAPARASKCRRDSAAARQVAALSHPGLLVLRRPYDTKSKRFASAIPVDEVRRLKSFLGLTSGEDAWRVVIVDTADELNLNAANALLKSLEEPPRRALFMLVASEPSGLLPTIRSRCRRLDLQPLAGASRCARPPRRLWQRRQWIRRRPANGTSSSGSPQAACAGRCSWPQRAGWNCISDCGYLRAIAAGRLDARRMCWPTRFRQELRSSGSKLSSSFSWTRWRTSRALARRVRGLLRKCPWRLV